MSGGGGGGGMQRQTLHQRDGNLIREVPRPRATQLQHNCRLDCRTSEI